MIYILLPSYNESQNLSKIFDEILSVNFIVPVSVVIVDDGSTDNTLEIIKKYENKLTIRIIKHENNMGLGKALKSGFIAVSKQITENDCLATLDADSTHPVKNIPHMLDLANKGYDMVIASRYCSGGGQSGLPFYRKALSFAASRLMKVLFPIDNVTDFTSGFRIYSGDLVKRLAAKYGENIVEEKGFAATIELLIKSSRFTSKICEYPLVLEYGKKYGASKMKLFQTIFRYFCLILKLKFDK